MNDTNATLADTDLDTAPPQAVKLKKRPGRKEDTTGETNLGKARLIHAANPDFTVKELKQRFESELKVNSQVAQTYASLVRRKKTATV